MRSIARHETDYLYADSMISGLDHIIVLTADLDAAVSAYTAVLGRQPAWRGQEGEARHAWFQLANIAIDVVCPGAQPRAMRRRVDEEGGGVYGLGFATPDLAETHRALGRRGVTLYDPADTVSTAADGATRHWSIAVMSTKTTAGVQLFLVQNDGTPRVLSAAVADEASAVSELDHVVVNSVNADRAVAIYGGRLGLDLRLDRSNADWGVRQLFFRCGTAMVEFGVSLKAPVTDAPDRLGGLAWRVNDADAARARIAAAGFDVSEERKGRKPGTRVFTLRSGLPGAPSLFIQQNAEPLA